MFVLLHVQKYYFTTWEVEQFSFVWENLLLNLKDQTEEVADLEVYQTRGGLHSRLDSVWVIITNSEPETSEPKSQRLGISHTPYSLSNPIAQ